MCVLYSSNNIIQLLLIMEGMADISFVKGVPYIYKSLLD